MVAAADACAGACAPARRARRRVESRGRGPRSSRRVLVLALLAATAAPSRSPRARSSSDRRSTARSVDAGLLAGLQGRDDDGRAHRLPAARQREHRRSGSGLATAGASTRSLPHRTYCPAGSVRARLGRRSRRRGIDAARRARTCRSSSSSARTARSTLPSDDRRRHDAAARSRCGRDAVPDHLARRRRARRTSSASRTRSASPRTRSCSSRPAGRVHTLGQKTTGDARLEREARSGRPWPSPPGRYVLTVAAQDGPATARSRSRSRSSQVRYVDARPDARRRRAPAAASRSACSTDAPQVDWRLHGRARRRSRAARSTCARRSGRASTASTSPAAGHAARRAVVGRVSGEARQSRGAVGALGLARADRRAPPRRCALAGLAAWAAGCAGARRLARAARAPPCARGRRACSGSSPPPLGAWLVRPRARGCSRSRCSRACRRGSPSTSARRRRTCCCRSTSSSPRRRSRSPGSSSATRPRSRELGPLAWPLALFVAWDGLAFLWTKDVRQGAIELLFFVLPFGLLAVVLARLPWSRAWVLTLYVQLAVMALVFAVIGVVQYETRNIFWNPKVSVDNAYAPSGWFYRVNSVFYDPSIYGRFLVVAILASLVVVLSGAATAVARSPRRWRSASPGPGCCPRSRSRASSRWSPRSWSARVVAWRGRGLLLVARGRRRAGRSRSSSRRPSGTRPSLSHVTSGRSTLVSNGRQGGRRTTRWSASASAASAARTRPGAPEGQGAEGGRLAHDADHGRRRDAASRARCSSLARRASALVTAFRRIVADVRRRAPGSRSV